MGLMDRIKIIRNNYVVNQVNKIEFPAFDKSEEIRVQVIFAGRVQNVGFRHEIYLIAGILKLHGFVENLSDGRVLMEVEGEKDRINFLIDFMKGLKRAKVKSLQVKSLELTREYKGFIII